MTVSLPALPQCLPWVCKQAFSKMSGMKSAE